MSNSDTYREGDTIAAITTPPGEGGVAIIRISGKNSISTANKIFNKDLSQFSSHTAHYGKILDKLQQTVDQVLVLLMLNGKSFTGEDTVEIHCHGGSLVARKILDLVLDAGARAAMPGEFSFQSFMNGKMDLIQAEAIQNMIGAQNELALNAATEQLEGRLSRYINEFQGTLSHLAAIIEAWVDFPEEGLEFASTEQICEELKQCQKKMHHLLETFHNGRIFQEGLKIALIGSPNVGKSSIMNALVDEDCAIVTPIPGTTRDTLKKH